MGGIVKGALQWIKESTPRDFYDRAKEAMFRAIGTGNEHAVVLGPRDWVSPVSAGDSHSVMPHYPEDPRFGFPDPRRTIARLHTHPIDPDFGITVAPSALDLSMMAKNFRSKPVREIIVSPQKDTFVDYSRDEVTDLSGLDRLYFELMKHTKGNLGGVEPVKPDVYFSALRKAAENRNSGTRMTYSLGDEAPYADEVYKTLKRLGLKKGGLVQMREQR